VSTDIQAIDVDRKLVRIDVIRAAIASAALKREALIVPDHRRRWGGWNQDCPAFALTVHEWDAAQLGYHLAVTCAAFGVADGGAELVKSSRMTGDAQQRPLLVFLGWQVVAEDGTVLEDDQPSERRSGKPQSVRRRR